MKRFATAALAMGLLVLPAGAVGVTGKDKANAARECRALKEAMGTDNFRETFGTNENKRNAFGKCVSRKSREEARERRAAKRKAKEECKAEAESSKSQGKGNSHAHGHAFRECVSEHAKENKADADAKDKQKVNAAKECKAEQDDPDFATSHDGKSFDEFYGTNENDKNAFGKCVSGKAHAKNG